MINTDSRKIKNKPGETPRPGEAPGSGDSEEKADEWYCCIYLFNSKPMHYCPLLSKKRFWVKQIGRKSLYYYKDTQDVLVEPNFFSNVGRTFNVQTFAKKKSYKNDYKKCLLNANLSTQYMSRIATMNIYGISTE